LGDEILVPVWVLAARDHRDRLAVVEVLLPVRKVDNGAEIIPCEDASHAGAYVERVEWSDVLVGFLVDSEEVLPFGREEGGVVFGIELRERYWKRKASCED